MKLSFESFKLEFYSKFNDYNIFNGQDFNYFKVVLLSAKQNTKLINKQLNIYKPKYFVIEDYKTFVQIKKTRRKFEQQIFCVDSLYVAFLTTAITKITFKCIPTIFTFHY